jgi:hypothetical protein
VKRVKRSPTSEAEANLPSFDKLAEPLFIDLVNQYRNAVLRILQTGARARPLTPTEIKTVSTSPGVYCLYEGKRMIYVGETSSLRARISELFETRHHTCRRTLGRVLYATHPNYEPASSKKAFSAEIESLLTSHMVTLRFLAVPVAFGRKEIETAILDADNTLLNSKRKRGQSPSQITQP